MSTPPLAEAINTLLLYARSEERLMGVINTTQPLVDAVGELMDLDPDLSPELGAALRDLRTFVDAIKRASVFQDARREAFVKAYID